MSDRPAAPHPWSDPDARSLTATERSACSISRRAALLGATALLMSRFSQGVAASAASALRINAGRLQQTLENLSVYGRPTGGSFADGVSRVAYSDADIAGRQYVLGLMKDAKLETHVDPAGNLFGRRAGRDDRRAPIMFGSHVDSVPSGGNFDGDLGSLAAIEVISTLNDHGLTTRYPLEVAVWSNEEGGTVGSRAAAGVLQPEMLEQRFNGILMADGLVRIGGDPTRLGDAKLARDAVHAYLELHIEQGGILERAGIPIGVVDGIVSIDEYDVEIRGFANHAGTTPMPDRRNALLAAAKLIEAVQEEVTRRPGRQVGNVGFLEVHPNARNVVPGMVRLSIELRDLSVQTLDELGAAIQGRAQHIAQETRTEIQLRKLERDDPALATPAIQRQIEAAAKDLGLPTQHLPSGAGHDAQLLAKLAPMGMIFVPSHNGISHSPLELTSWTDCANGANVLLQTILRLDRS